MNYLLYFLLLAPASAQLISPCPRLFKYEPQGAENDRWYGVVTLLSDSELSGVWLRLIFDKQSIQLGVKTAFSFIKFRSNGQIFCRIGSAR